MGVTEGEIILAVKRSVVDGEAFLGFMDKHLVDEEEFTNLLRHLIARFCVRNEICLVSFMNELYAKTEDMLLDYLSKQENVCQLLKTLATEKMKKDIKKGLYTPEEKGE